MKVPKISIKKESNVSHYYIYRGTLNNLSDDIGSYNRIDPIACIINDGSNTTHYFTDNRSIAEEGIEKYGNNPILIGKPNIELTTELTNIRGAGHIPYYRIKVNGVDEKILLHYRVLCDNSVGSVSDLSNVVSVELQQSGDDVLAWVEYKVNDNWVKLCNISINEYVDILKPTKPNSENIFSGKVYSFEDKDISFQNKYSRSDNISIVSINNPWHSTNSDVNYRDTKEFRVACTIGDDNIVYSETINSSKQYSPIDKVVILRKEYDGTSSHLSLSDDNVIVKQIIRAGGLYSTNEIESIQFNEETITGDYAVVNFDNSFKEIKLVDRGIIHGRKYKYTFMSYDHTGEESAKHTVINLA